MGLTCEVDFVGAYMDEDTEKMLLLNDISASSRAAKPRRRSTSGVRNEGIMRAVYPCVIAEERIHLQLWYDAKEFIRTQ